MNREEFNQIYKDFKLKDKIEIPCSTINCHRIEKLKKGSAIRNIRKNGSYICRSCSYTEDGKKRIAQATSYSRSDETKAKMSEAKKAFYNTPEGKINRRNLSVLTAEGHGDNKYENAKRDGWYFSKKNSKYVYYGSSYEMRLCHVLDEDENVITYETQVPYEINDRGRCLDFLVTYHHGRKRAIEVKPEKRLNEPSSVEQISDSHTNANKMGWDFQVYTEVDFGMVEKEILDWADNYRTEMGDFDWVSFRKKQRCERSIRWYQKTIAGDTVVVYCEFCQKEHTPLRLTYEKNIARNGSYVCEKKGGHITGSKPKKKKTNPYAMEGKKECSGCKMIKSLDDFGCDKSHADGHASRCRECRAKQQEKSTSRAIRPVLVDTPDFV